MSSKHNILTPYQKECIIRMREKDISFSEISYCLDIGLSQAKMFMSRNELMKQLPPKTEVKKRLTDGRVGLEIIRIVWESPRTPVRKCPSLLKERLTPGTPIPAWQTIERYLLNNNLQHKVMLKKSFIRPINIQKRILFAKECLDKPNDFFDYVIWSDETSIHSIPSKKQYTMRVHASTPREEMPYNGQLQGGGFNVMFWGCFSKMGLGPLLALEGSQNQHTYRKLLQEHVIPEIKSREEECGCSVLFMQDNAPCHKAKLIIDYFEENHIETLNWPPQSPDLNPIENLWNWITRKLESEFPFPTTREQLIGYVMEIWDKIPEKIVETLCESVPRRLSEVLRMKGRPTKY